jgi:hypothetical protein
MSPACPSTPNGHDAARKLLNPHWPEARWDVSGAFAGDLVLARLHRFAREQLGLILFSQVHGAPPCLWAGGRVKQQFLGRQAIERIIRGYEAVGVSVCATFTNVEIPPDRLGNGLGNFILACLSQYNPAGNNGVILCEETLADHVRREHPGLRRIASVVKIAKEQGKGNADYYRRLADRYDKVMVHPDDNVNLDLLAQLEQKDKYEILVNEQCILGCQMRTRHYEGISAQYVDPFDLTPSEEGQAMLARNRCLDLRRLLPPDSPARTLVLSTHELRQLYELGFRNFKIQGRGLNNDQLLGYQVLWWTLNQDPDVDHLTARLMQTMLGD